MGLPYKPTPEHEKLRQEVFAIIDDMPNWTNDDGSGTVIINHLAPHVIAAVRELCDNMAYETLKTVKFEAIDNMYLLIMDYWYDKGTKHACIHFGIKSYMIFQYTDDKHFESHDCDHYYDQLYFVPVD